SAVPSQREGGRGRPVEESAVAGSKQASLNAQFVSQRAPVPFPPLRMGGTGGWRGTPRKSSDAGASCRKFTPPDPPFARGGKSRHKFGGSAQVFDLRLFITPGLGWAGRRQTRRSALRLAAITALILATVQFPAP